MAERPPCVNYNPARNGSRDHLVLDVPEREVIAAVERIKAKQQRTINLSALRAFFDIAEQFKGRRFADVNLRYYPIGRRLHVPVKPFLYTRGPSAESLLWPSFWNELKLREDQLAVYATILDMRFLSSPDFCGCALEFADLGCSPGEKTRRPHVMRRSDLPTLSAAELKEFTDSFAEVFLKLVAEIRGTATEAKRRSRSEAPADWYLDKGPPPP
jgi:hypothetical protein